MILLDSCVVLEILFGAEDAIALAKILDASQAKGQEILFLNLNLLESSAVIAVRAKEKKISGTTLEEYLAKLTAFQTLAINDDLTQDLITKAAGIKANHAASMIDCYLIANARHRNAEIITTDKEILTYDNQHAKLRKLTPKFSGIRWRI